MSYTYLALEYGYPVVALPRKHELERWCELGNRGSARLFRVRSFTWSESSVVELEYENGTLINKVPG